ncbi:MAG: hypothetical protein KKC55_01005 [Gammaproteobacteria bacterium]|nr:hypothetical protein [Gammaproteobacteria bacterium]
MRETLYLRLPPAHHDAPEDAPCEFCVAPAEALQSWPVEQSALKNLAPLALGKRLVVLWPSADLRMDLLDLPVKQASKAAQAARFSLEEAVADEPDELHLIAAPRQADGFPVLSMRRQRFEAGLALLQSVNLHPDLIIPDVLGLPEPEDTQLYAWLEDGIVTVRHRQWASFQCEVDDLPAALQLAVGGRDTPQGLTLYLVGHGAPDLTGLPQPPSLRPGFAFGLSVLLPQLHPQLTRLSTLNLLQGAYAPSGDLGAALKPWRWPLALAASLALVVGLEHVIASQRLAGQIAEQEAANIARFQQLFPSQTRIVDLSAQAEQQLAALRAGNGGQAFLGLLSPLSTALETVEGLQLQGLQFREGALVASLTGSSLQPLETLRARFADDPVVQMDVQSANAGADGAQIRLRLQRRSTS